MAYGDIYRDVLRDQSVGVDEVSRGDDFGALEDYLLKRADDDLQTYINDDLVAGYFDDNYTVSVCVSICTYLCPDVLYRKYICAYRYNNEIWVQPYQ